MKIKGQFISLVYFSLFMLISPSFTYMFMFVHGLRKWRNGLFLKSWLGKRPFHCNGEKNNTNWTIFTCCVSSSQYLLIVVLLLGVTKCQNDCFGSVEYWCIQYCISLRAITEAIVMTLQPLRSLERPFTESHLIKNKHRSRVTEHFLLLFTFHRSEENTDHDNDDNAGRWIQRGSRRSKDRCQSRQQRSLKLRAKHISAHSTYYNAAIGLPKVTANWTNGGVVLWRKAGVVRTGKKKEILIEKDLKRLKSAKKFFFSGSKSVVVFGDWRKSDFRANKHTSIHEAASKKNFPLLPPAAVGRKLKAPFIP